MKKCLSMLLALIMVISMGMPANVNAAEKKEDDAKKLEKIFAAELADSKEAKRKKVEGKENQISTNSIETHSSYTGEAQALAVLEERVKEGLLAGQTEISIEDLNLTWNDGVGNIDYFSPYIGNGIEFQYVTVDDADNCYEAVFTNSMSVAETKKYFAKVDAKLDEIGSLLKSYMGEEDVALVIHDYLVYEYEYDYDRLLNGTMPYESYTSAGLLMKGKGVCQAYAYTYMYLLTLAGIECHVTSSEEINHAWNIIKVSGKYYHVDCTWDDPVYDRIGYVGHNYFMVSDAAIQTDRSGGGQTHAGWDRTDLACTDTSYDDVFWRGVPSQIVYDEGGMYFLLEFTDEEGYLYFTIFKIDLVTGEMTALVDDIGTWYVWDGAGAYWLSSFSGLFLYEGELYYNTESEIRKVSVDGSSNTLVYKPDTSNGYIYGTRRSGNEIQYIILQSPGDKMTEVLTTPLSGKTEATAISLDSESLQLLEGETAKLNYTISPSDAETTVSWKSSDKAVATVDQSGNVAAISEGTATITVTTENGLTAECKVTVEKVPVQIPFTDVPESEWFYSAVQYAYENNIMAGTSTTTFGPNESLTRAQFAAILYRSAGSPEVTYDSRFSDIPNGQYYSDAVIWANDMGVVHGVAEGVYAPFNNISREQMAAMMYRYAVKVGYDTGNKASIDGFADAAAVSDYAVEAMEWAYGNGIVSGKLNNMLDPQGEATRAECAAIIMRFLEKYK